MRSEESVAEWRLLRINSLIRYSFIVLAVFFLGPFRHFAALSYPNPRREFAALAAHFQILIERDQRRWQHRQHEDIGQNIDELKQYLSCRSIQTQQQREHFRHQASAQQESKHDQQRRRQDRRRTPPTSANQLVAHT